MKLDEAINTDKLNLLIKENMVILDDYLKVTDKGRLILNQILSSITSQT